MRRSRPLTYLVLLVVLVGGLILTWSISGGQQAPALNYSDLINRAQAGKITSLTINGSDGTALDQEGKRYTVTLPGNTATLAQQLTADGVDVRYQSSGGTLGYLVASLLPSLIFLLLIGGFMFYIFRQTQSGNNQAMSFGRSRARMIAGDKPQVTFADVAGVDEAKQELTEVV
ncbi:MAG TPA: ATP-dependent metallopeptidase FtsH/Yme1/Tma family protein, partial [Candidatus Dormibacteraeota bacterium]|nr:ATP-dependent metallopeptidase FtsH/Yme1/Tma family protein [Candidatus Dormibacteraeota bacterium]